MPKLQNLVIVMLERGFQWYGKVPCPKRAWEAADGDIDCMLWKFAQDCFVSQVTGNKHAKVVDSMPHEILVQLILAKGERTQKQGKDYFVKED